MKYSAFQVCLFVRLYLCLFVIDLTLKLKVQFGLSIYRPNAFRLSKSEYLYNVVL